MGGSREEVRKGKERRKGFREWKDFWKRNLTVLFIV